MFDYLIKGGTIVDGTGAESFQADIAITGDRIVAIGTLDGDAAEVISLIGPVTRSTLSLCNAANHSPLSRSGRLPPGG